MSSKTALDDLFKEHSFEEIESIRDNLASEIAKRTNSLKSIVKEKYRDVLDTSEAIQSMKSNLNKFERSIHKLDKSIARFHTNIGETNLNRRLIRTERSSLSDQYDTDDHAETSIDQLLSISTEILDYLDAGDFKTCLILHKQGNNLLKEMHNKQYTSQQTKLIESLEFKLKRDYEMIKNKIWHKIQTAESNQIGIIAGSDEQDLYTLSLQVSIEFLVEKFQRDISDVSYQAQIRRYEQYSYYNTTTNTIDYTVNDMKPPTSADYVQIPKAISQELSAFLFDICRVINTIAGFSLSRSSIIDSLRATFEQLVKVYTGLVVTIDKLTSGSKRRRALQLYFDLMYLRVLLNTAKDFELMEELDPKIFALMSKFELMLDTIELYTVSDSLHRSVLHLSNSTIRLYGLLVPYLQ